jgi:hypothetical protein
MHDEVASHEVDAVLARAVGTWIEWVEDVAVRVLGKPGTVIAQSHLHALPIGTFDRCGVDLHATALG